MQLDPKSIIHITAMNHLHPVFAFGLYIEVFLIIWFLNRWVGLKPVQGHSPEIDGLRGLLAFGVFIHHASIWYHFLRTGSWVAPDSRLYTHLGQSTVSLFFMITGFLFFGKLQKSKNQTIDWLRLYVSRCLRIIPLYLAVMLIGALIIALIRHSGGVNPMAPPWNEKSLTALYTAGVTWTLSYEWKFYFALPLLASLFVKVPLQWILFAIGMLLVTGAHKALDIYALTFLGGGVALWLGRFNRWKTFSRSGWGSTLALLGLIIAIEGFDTAYAIEPLLILTLTFSLLANGASLWGLLSAGISRVFGEITFSLYLLHGPILFVFFQFFIGMGNAAKMHALSYWLTLSALVPVLLIASMLSFVLIERPSMQKTQAWTDHLKTWGAVFRARFR